MFLLLIEEHHFDRINTLDILDCNGGDHGHPFATNFNPEINIREVTAPARHWENESWVKRLRCPESKPSISQSGGAEYVSDVPRGVGILGETSA